MRAGLDHHPATSHTRNNCNNQQRWPSRARCGTVAQCHSALLRIAAAHNAHCGPRTGRVRLPALPGRWPALQPAHRAAATRGLPGQPLPVSKTASVRRCAPSRLPRCTQVCRNRCYTPAAHVADLRRQRADARRFSAVFIPAALPHMVDSTTAATDGPRSAWDLADLARVASRTIPQT